MSRLMPRLYRENPYDGFDARSVAYGARRMEQHRSGVRQANSQDKIYPNNRGLIGWTIVFDSRCGR